MPLFQRRKRPDTAAQGMLIPTVVKAVASAHRARLYPFRRATVMGQAADGTSLLLAGVGEKVADGAAYPTLLTYTTYTVGAAGGPQLHDDILLVSTDDGYEVVLGRSVLANPR